MVIVEGLGDECRQATRSKEGDRRLARRLAVIMHRIWVNGSVFRWTDKTMSTAT
jgi:hypothetical protein